MLMNAARVGVEKSMGQISGVGCARRTIKGGGGLPYLYGRPLALKSACNFSASWSWPRAW